MIHQWDIESDLVGSVDTRVIQDALTQLGSDPDEARRWQGSVALTFSQFEDGDPPYMEPSVRRYLRALYARVPHLPYS